MTSFIEEEQVTAALEAGASGYVLKDAEAEEVAAAVRAAYNGEVHLDPAVARLLAQRMRNRKSPDESLVEPLTDREKDVLSLLGQGMSNKEIGTALFITERTARTYVSNILGKLGLASRTQAALYAVEHKLVEPPRSRRRTARRAADGPSRSPGSGSAARRPASGPTTSRPCRARPAPGRPARTTRCALAPGPTHRRRRSCSATVSPSSSTVTTEPSPTREPAAGASTMTADRSRASIAWTRPSRNDCSSRAAWYSEFSLRSPCSLAVRIRAMTCGPLDLGQLVELGPQPGLAIGGQVPRPATDRGGRSLASRRRCRAAGGVRRSRVRAAPPAPALRRGRFAAGPVGVAVGDLRRRVSAAAAARPARRAASRSARSPCARPSAAAGWPTAGRRSGRGGPARSALGDARRRTPPSRASSYSSVAVGRRPPDPDARRASAAS